MPFGKHNAALPEMQYKMPSEIGDKPTKLSYFDIIKKKNVNLETEEEKKDGRWNTRKVEQDKINAFFTDPEYDLKLVADKLAIVNEPKESKNENEENKDKKNNRQVGGGGRGGGGMGMGGGMGLGRGGNLPGRQVMFGVGGDMAMLMDMGRMMFGFDPDAFEGIQPRNFVHEIEGYEEGTVCIGLYCELQNRQGDNQVKAKITLREGIERERLNFEFPMTPVVHYTNN